MRALLPYIPRLLRLFRGLLRDPRVGRLEKAMLLGGALWLVSPIDPIPDFLPVIGSLDDVAVALLVGRFVLKRVPDDVLADHWKGDLEQLHRLLRRG